MRTVATLFMLCALTGAARAESRPLYSPGGRNCPAGYAGSGDYCRPNSAGSRPAVERPRGAYCPAGYQSSGGACIKS